MTATNEVFAGVARLRGWHTVCLLLSRVLQFQYGFTTWMGICWGSLVFAPGDAHSNGSRFAAQLEPVPRGQSLEPEHLPGPGRDQFGCHHEQHQTGMALS